MHVLMVAAENDAIPSAKVGGIADVIRDIPPVLANNNVAVDVVIPAHLNYNDTIDSRHVADARVNFSGSIEHVALYEIFLTDSAKNTRQFIIQHPLFSTATGIYSHDADDRPFASDANKYALFSLAVCHFINDACFSSATSKQPDVIHLHDWHAATVAVLCQLTTQFQALKNIHTVYTVHNIALQGIRPFSGDKSSLMHWFSELFTERSVEASSDSSSPIGLICDPRYPDCYNPMRAGINLCNKVHLVSPSYANEVMRISDPANGFFGGEGLEHDLIQAHMQSRLVGILNGCDYSAGLDSPKTSYQQLIQTMNKQVKNWLCLSEVLQTVHYLASERLQQWQNQEQQGMLVTSVGRLTEQKVLLLRQPYQGKFLLSALLTDLAAQQGRMIILGSGNKDIELEFMQLMAYHDNFLFLNGYGQNISELLYQQGQLFLMPSSFEPCGISQMLAMKAGQPCLVHDIGGLKDTVKHKENGFSFHGVNLAEQADALHNQFRSAMNLFEQKPEFWEKISLNAKASRFNWQDSIELYINDLYNSVRIDSENVA